MNRGKRHCGVAPSVTPLLGLVVVVSGRRVVVDVSIKVTLILSIKMNSHCSLTTAKMVNWKYRKNINDLI